MSTNVAAASAKPPITTDTGAPIKKTHSGFFLVACSVA